MESGPFVTVCESQIRLSKKVKYLGVWLSSDLSWHRQACSLTAKCYGALQAISHFKGSLNLHVRRLLAQSLAIIHLDFCLVVMTSSDVKTGTMIQVAQNACVCFISGQVSDLGWRDRISKTRRRLGFLCPCDRMRVKYSFIASSTNSCRLLSWTSSTSWVVMSSKEGVLWLPLTYFAKGSFQGQVHDISLCHGTWGTLPNHIHSHPIEFKRAITNFHIHAESQEHNRTWHLFF